MALDVQSLDQLSTTQITQATALAQQLLLEKYPNIDTKRGVISELVIGLDAILHAAQRANLSLERQSHSLAAITANPTLATDAIVDDVLSNFRMARRSATFAKGEITVIVSQQLVTTITNGTVFTANGVEYAADTAYVARVNSENVIFTTDRLLTQIATDRYAFTINATAVVAGSGGSVAKDTQFIPKTGIASFVRAYAASSFTTGLDAQTNSDLITLLQAGVAARAWSNRVNIPATIRNADQATFAVVTDAFPAITAMSIVGFGDGEMQRDQHWLFPVSGGGRCDLYLRSQTTKKSQSIVKSATLVDSVAQGGIWQFSLGRDEVPGFYEASKILVQDADSVNSGYEVKEDIRGVDLTGTIYTPDVTTALEGTYSKYQTATIRFLDTDTAVTEADVNTKTQNYDVTVDSMPLVKELQEYLGDRQVLWPAGDILVKAAIPCDLSLNFEIQRRNTTATVDTTAIKKALAAYVNSQGFSGVLYASALARVVDELLPVDIDAGAIDMFGRIRRPDGKISYIRNDNFITVPEDLPSFTSGRTVAFILAVESIAIDDISVSVPAV